MRAWNESNVLQQITFYDFKFLPYIPHSYLMGKRNKQHSLSTSLRFISSHTQVYVGLCHPRKQEHTKKLKFYKLYRRQSISYPPIISVDLSVRERENMNSRYCRRGRKDVSFLWMNGMKKGRNGAERPRKQVNSWKMVKRTLVLEGESKYLTLCGKAESFSLKKFSKQPQFGPQFAFFSLWCVLFFSPRSHLHTSAITLFFRSPFTSLVSYLVEVYTIVT